MSQEKVDKYKKEKANRKQIMRRDPRTHRPPAGRRPLASVLQEGGPSPFSAFSTPPCESRFPGIEGPCPSSPLTALSYHKSPRMYI